MVLKYSIYDFGSWLISTSVTKFRNVGIFAIKGKEFYLNLKVIEL